MQEFRKSIHLPTSMAKAAFTFLFSCLLVFSLREVHAALFTWPDSASTSQNKCENGLITCTASHLLSDLSNLLRYSPSSNHHNELPALASFSDRRALKVKIPRDKTSRSGHIVVDKYGPAPYKTITEAIRAAIARRVKHKGRIVINVKKGIYEETVVIPKSLTNLTLIGDGIDATVITGRKHVEKQGDHTSGTTTVFVEGDGFVAKKMTVRNEAGPGTQAVALYSSSDRSVFYKCSFQGFQDTLFLHLNRQFYRNCDIYGTTDFIFGGAKAVLQKCNIYVKRHGNNGVNFIAAPGGAGTDSGIVIQNSRIRPAPDLVPVQKKFRTYLGRPWRDYARLVYIGNDIGDFIDLQGWFNHRNPETKEIHFIEYNNYGLGSNTSKRLRGESYKVATSSKDVKKFTVERFLKGASWISESNVAFMPGLASR